MYLSSSRIEESELIQRFQEGDLPEDDEEWAKLVPQQVREMLSKKEVQRQSTIFEVIKSERDYTLDLQLIDSVSTRTMPSCHCFTK
jgi:RHO1 GDP-GTP exchange protein 1/2